MKELLPFLFPAALVAISIFFRSRRNSTPSTAERLAAFAWLIIRRIVCFGAAGLCIVAAGALVYSMFRASVSAIGIVGIALALSFAFILAHWGIYGTGYSRYDVKDDRTVHELRKK